MTPRWLAALLLVVALGGVGCRRKSAAERVADRFVDLYYVEIDQRAALDITAGRAHDELSQQLIEVGHVRGAAAGEGERPRTYYERVSHRADGEVAIFVYDLTTKMGRSAGVHRHATIGLAKRDGRWRVIWFGETEGKAPRAPK
ncbi:MAG: hypothetical protein IT370_19235 [Deltaproteobacteria bacterium]|nr:hypothetical protein [Deltaproteobacteria bacterium]